MTVKKNSVKLCFIISSRNSEDEDVELQAYSYVENAEGTEGDLQQIETDAEWDMIEEVFNTFMAEEEE